MSMMPVEPLRYMCAERPLSYRPDRKYLEPMNTGQIRTPRVSIHLKPAMENSIKNCPAERKTISSITCDDLPVAGPGRDCLVM